MNHKPKLDGRMIWLDQIRRPIWLHCMSHFSVLTCHFPFWQMRHTRWAGYPSDRWSIGLQLHQRCYQQWSRGTRLISAHSWRFLWEPSDHWLFHGMKSWLAAEKEELNQSQCWKRGAILLKWKVVFLYGKTTVCKGGRYTLGKNWPGSKQYLFSTMPRQIWIILFSIYTKTVDSVFRALWLATQSLNILHYSLIHVQFLRASDAKLS